MQEHKAALWLELCSILDHEVYNHNILLNSEPLSHFIYLSPHLNKYQLSAISYKIIQKVLERKQSEEGQRNKKKGYGEIGREERRQRKM